MIEINDLKKIMKLVLISGYLKKEKPLNLMLLSSAGSGKTEIISTFKSPRITFQTDLSYMGLLKLLKEKKQIKHLIIPDYTKITNKKKSTADNLTSLLNAMIEEGIGEINLFQFRENFKNRNVGLILTTTKASFAQKKDVWEKSGFPSRFIICSYKYSDKTRDKIIQYINAEMYKDYQNKIVLKGFKDCEVISTEELNKQLNPYTKKQFRSLKQLQTLAKSNAINEGRKKVSEKDIKEIIRLSKYLNLNYTEV